VIFGTGKFGPPSITVFDAGATGNVEPVRHVVGPKTQLNWPTGISVDSDRGEVYVSNAAGDSINVYSATANGDAGHSRNSNPCGDRDADRGGDGHGGRF